MPSWIHHRAEHILAKNPSMPKSEAFAIATQQSHSIGKSPKGYGTIEGRETAKEKYKTPEDDKKTANPGHLESPKMAAAVVVTTPPAAAQGKSTSSKKPQEPMIMPAPGLSVMFAPKPRGQANAMLAVDRAKTAFVLEKVALLERLVRLGATDVPNTPRLLMRHRSPEELAALQQGVEDAFQRVQGPLKERVGKLVGGTSLPEGAKKVLKGGAGILIDHPETIPMQAIPIPGLTPGWLAAKKGMEAAIDRVAPAKLAAGAPTRGGFMMASDVPPITAPSLRAPVQKLAGNAPDEKLKAAEAARVAVQEASAALHKVGEILTKVGDSLPDYVTYSPGDFKPANLNQKPKTAEGAGDGMSMDSQTAAENEQPEDFKKKADVGPSVAWNPGTGGAQRQASYMPPMRAPSLRAPVAKLAAVLGPGMGSKSTQPPPPIPAPTVAKTIGTPKMKAPGPSIADVAKPKGPGFGSGIAGAYKPQTGVGGTGPIDMNTRLGPSGMK